MKQFLNVLSDAENVFFMGAIYPQYVIKNNRFFNLKVEVPM